MFKKLFFVLFIVSLSSYATKPHVTSVKADTEKSYVYWRGNEVGGYHDGNIKLRSGYIISDHGKLVGGKFIIDMNTITNLDIKSEKYSQKLVNHLKDDHFFDVEKFPTSVLIIKNVKKISDQNYNITADLTIRGITNEINFISNVRLRGNQFQAEGDIVIDRTKWDVKYRSSIVGTVADKLIEDNIEFKVFLYSVSR